MPEIEIPRRLGAVAAACDRVEAMVQAQGWAPTDVSRVAIALGEAIANAFEHGDDASPQPILLHLQLDGSALTIRVLDGGPGPSPERLARARLPADPLATGGRGLYIQTQLADAVQVDPEGGVALTFRRRS